MSHRTHPVSAPPAPTRRAVIGRDLPAGRGRAGGGGAACSTRRRSRGRAGGCGHHRGGAARIRVLGCAVIGAAVAVVPRHQLLPIARVGAELVADTGVGRLEGREERGLAEAGPDALVRRRRASAPLRGLVEEGAAGGTRRELAVAVDQHSLLGNCDGGEEEDKGVAGRSERRHGVCELAPAAVCGRIPGVQWAKDAAAGATRMAVDQHGSVRVLVGKESTRESLRGPSDPRHSVAVSPVAR